MIPFSNVLGESFTGYLQRFSNEETANPMALWKHILHNPTRYPQSSESAILDHNPFSFIDVQKLTLTTGLPKNQIERSTMLQLTRRLVGISDPKCSRSRILSGELADTRRYCPICLKEKGYYQLYWQINEIQICLEHQIFLFDQCPSCGKPVYCLFPWARVGYCQCGYDLRSIRELKPVQTDEVKEHERIWRDWQQLMESFTVPNMNGLDNKRSLAIAILCVANNFSTRFEGIDTINSGLNRATISSLLQAARGSKAIDTFVHTRTLLSVLREKELSVADFAKLQVPESFVNSINQRHVEPIRKYSCKAPWCKSFGKGDRLTKTSTSSKIRMDGSKLKYYFYCWDCGIEYALNESGEMVERGYFIEVGWRQVKELVLANKSRKQVAQKLNITVDQVIRCTAYMAANGLLSKETRNKFLGKSENKQVLDRILEQINNGVHIKAIQRELKLPYHEFLYYRYKVEAIRAINSIVKTRSSKINLDENHIQAMKVLRELLNNEEKITIELVAQELGVCHETLRNWDVLPLIAEYKERQRKEKDEKFASDLTARAEKVIRGLVEAGEEVTSQKVYNELGVRRNVLVRRFPNVTKYTASLLKKQRDKQHQARVNEYISTAKYLIEAAKYSGEKVTVEDIADALELSVAGVSRYPQILGLLRDAK